MIHACIFKRNHVRYINCFIILERFGKSLQSTLTWDQRHDLINVLSQTALVIRFFVHGWETAVLVRYLLHWSVDNYWVTKKRSTAIWIAWNPQSLNVERDAAHVILKVPSVFPPPIMSGWHFLTFSFALWRFRCNFAERVKGMASATVCRGTKKFLSSYVDRF